jgi:preprotein translocase subunit SecY
MNFFERFLEKSRLKDIFGTKELRDRIFYTLALLAIYRLGSYIVLPGVNGAAVAAQANSSNSNDLLNLVNAFTGGSFFNVSIFALGIMPYISASIVVQLLGFAVPQFKKMQSEGESGTRKLNQITRMLTIVITIFQAITYLGYIKGAFPNVVTGSEVAHFSNALLITAGTVICMWLGERITDHGLGNGTSLIIAIGIVARLPEAFFGEFDLRKTSLILFTVELAMFVAITLCTIALIQAIYKIPLQRAMASTARSARFSPEGGGSVRDYLPIKLNTAGVMPIIFAQALMFIPATIYQAAAGGSTNAFIDALNKPDSLVYNVIYFVMIVLFTYVYTALVIDPKQQSDFLQRNNTFIAVNRLKPGQETIDYIDNVVSHITLPGALALGVVAILPPIVMGLGLVKANTFAYFFGGTSLIIMIGVALDTLQQIENHLLAKKYDGLIQGGRIKGRGAFSSVE